jgi:hypothetical protein
VVQSAIAAITKALSPENIKRRCARLFASLGISPSDVVAKMKEATYYNASAMFTPFLTFSDASGYQSWAGAWLWEERLDANITVSAVFQAKPGLNAIAVAAGDFVFLRGLGAVSPGTLAHEAIHLVGRTELYDPDIMGRWGIRNRSRGSILITERIEKDCL